MKQLGEAIAWRWRRLSKPATRLGRAVGALPRRLAAARNGARFEGELAAFAAAPRGGSGAAAPRILAIGDWTFPRHSQSFVYEELAALVAAGFDLVLAASAPGPREALAPAARKIAPRVTWLPSDARTGRRALAALRVEHGAAIDALFNELEAATGRPRHELAGEPHLLRAFAFARLAAACGADYLHSYFFYEGALAAFVAQRLLGLPRGFTAYSDHQLDDYPLKMVRRQVAAADLPVATSRRIRDELAALSPESAGRILVKPNSVDTSFFNHRAAAEPPPGEPHRLVTVARFDEKKGLEPLIEALAEVRKSVPARLHLVGGADGDARRAGLLEARLHEEVDRRGLGDSVRFRGLLSAEEVRSELHAAHLFVAPYLETGSGDKDGIPTAVLEAMSCGTPVLATRAGSLPEAVDDGVSGRLIDAAEPHLLAREILRLLESPAERERLGRGASRVRERFSSAHAEAPLAARIRELLAARRAASFASREVPS